ncbi:MAG TPA: APC family permease, partial [Chlamydiales bacterium]|nr:APC family permease [Chlamydiales bacterium]
MRQKIAQIDKGAMRRVLGIRELFAVGYGDLGSSIYYALGITALYALGATPIALALAGLVFACTALTYAEMSSMTRDSGGSASYTRRAFNDLVSFIAGWGLLLDFIVTIAISSYAVSSYLAYFFPLLKLVQWKIFFTVVLIGSLGYLNVRGVKHSVKLSSVLTSLTVITQGIIIVVGALTIVSIPDFIEHLKIGISGSSWSPSWSDFMKGCAMAMVAYTGIESMTQLASEAKNPSKTVPKAIMY